MIFEGENSLANDAPFIAGETDTGDNQAENKTETSESAANSGADTLAVQEESVARARGWVPQGEFRGRAEDWQDAKSFLDRNASLQKDVGELKARLTKTESDYQDKLSRLERLSESAIKRTREQASSQIEAAKREAATLGDAEEYDRLVKEESRLYDRFRQEDEASKPAAKEDSQVSILPETQEWMSKNPWFNTNAALNSVALGFYHEAAERFVHEADKLKFVDERLAATYPDRFADKASKASSNMPSLEGGRRMSGGQDKVSQLPADVRAVGERYVKRGLFKDIAAYAKEYFDE